jgi:hypothetical protein
MLAVLILLLLISMVLTNEEFGLYKWYLVYVGTDTACIYTMFASNWNWNIATTRNYEFLTQRLE